MKVFSLSFTGDDKQRIDLTRDTPAMALAAAIGKEKRKTCKVCGLTKAVQCFIPHEKTCQMCGNKRLSRINRSRRQRKART